jgi:MOSC domain-containing protein YiiM
LREDHPLETLATLKSRFPRPGRVVFIGVRPARRAPVEVPDRVEVTEAGLVGDRYAGRDGKRAVTLIQYEHLRVIESLTGCEALDPALLRRNLAVAGLNLLALRGQRFRIGSALFEATGACAPCSRMEELFGAGGYNALRGHGGITARVIEPGIIELGDSVVVEPPTV